MIWRASGVGGSALYTFLSIDFKILLPNILIHINFQGSPFTLLESSQNFWAISGSFILPSRRLLAFLCRKRKIKLPFFSVPLPPPPFLHSLIREAFNYLLSSILGLGKIMACCLQTSSKLLRSAWPCLIFLSPSPYSSCPGVLLASSHPVTRVTIKMRYLFHVPVSPNLWNWVTFLSFWGEFIPNRKNLNNHISAECNHKIQWAFAAVVF